jgi:simple sugar transport system ATP-binding protein
MSSRVLTSFGADEINRATNDRAETAPPVLTLRGISKRFGPLAALDDVSLTIERGKVHCLLGENGAGKSTLCNVIFGVHQPDTGEICLDGRPFRPTGPADSLAAGIAMVHQHFSVIGAMTVVENLMMGQSRGRLQRNVFAERIRELSQTYDLAVDPDRLVDDLSVGERQRVEVVKCLMREPRLLLLDEPTAVLPPPEVDALLEICRKVADRGRGVILVTHKLVEIARIADQVTVLRAGRVVDSAPMAGAEMGRFVRSMIGRDIASLDTVLSASLGAKPAAPPAEAKAKARTRRAGAQEDALTVDAVSFYDKAGVQRLDAITIEVRRGEIVGLAGVEGNGQSELGAILAGLAAPSSGRLFIAGREVTGLKPKAITAAGAGIVPEDRHASACILDMSVAENLFLGDLGRFSAFGLVRRSAMTEAAADLMRRHDVRAPSASAPMANLSGGNQQKAVLARELSLDPLVFLLAAQPTRGLDIGAVGAVYDRIRRARDAGVGVLLISSELDELIAVADRILVIFRGRIIGAQPADPSAREAIGRLMAGETLREPAA